MALTTENPALNNLWNAKGSAKQNASLFADMKELMQAKQQADNMAQNARHKVAESDYEVSHSGMQKAAMMQSIESGYHYSETMQISLTTKEGDQVNVDFRQLYSQYQSYKEFKAGSETPSGVRYFESKDALEATAFEEHFGFAVQGDLNEQELQAIYDVFQKVDDLANHFFNGDIEKAFAKAVELEVDFSQISSFSLNLTQTEVKAVRYQQAAMAEYQKQQALGNSDEMDDATAVASQHPAVNGEQESDQDSLQQLPVYLQKWQEAINRLEEFFDNTEVTLNEWVGEVAAQRFPEQGDKPSWIERVTELHEKLAEKLAEKMTHHQDIDANKATDKVNELGESVESQQTA